MTKLSKILCLLMLCSSAFAGSFNDRFKLERDESGKLITIRSKAVNKSLSITSYVKQIESDLTDLSNYIFGETKSYGFSTALRVERKHQIIDKFLDEIEIHKANSSSFANYTDPEERSYMKKALMEMEHVDLGKSFQEIESEGIIKFIENKMAKYTRYIALDVIANPSDPKFFYKKNVGMTVVREVLKFAKKRLSDSTLINLALFVVTDVHKRIVEQRIISQHMLMYYLAHAENKTDLSPEEVDMVMSSIYESRLGIMDYVTSQKMGEKWRDYGWNQYDSFRRAAKKRMEATDGASHKNCNKLVSVFYEGQTMDGQKVIFNGAVTKHSYSGSPSISYYFDSPNKVRNMRVMIQLGQVGLGFLKFVPGFIKSQVNSFANSWYKQQSFVDSILYSHFESKSNKQMALEMRRQIANPFFIY